MQREFLVPRTTKGLWSLTVLKCGSCIFGNRGDPPGCVHTALSVGIGTGRWQTDASTPVKEFISIRLSSHCHLFDESQDRRGC